MPRVFKVGLSKKKSKILFFSLLLVGLVFFLYFWRLGTLVPGMSPAEIAARNSSQSLSLIMDNPLNAPHKLAQFVFQYFDQRGAFWMRLPSALFAVAVLFSFYYLVKGWFGRFVSLIGTLFLAATPFVVILGRSATPDIMLLLPVVIFASYAHLARANKGVNVAWLLFMALLALSLYIPAMAWLILVGLIVGGKPLIKIISKLNPLVISGGLIIFFALIIPLVLALTKEPQLIKNLLALPGDWPDAVGLLKSAGWTLLAFIWRANEHIAYTVGRLPLLDVAQVALAITGIYALWSKARKVMLLISAFGVATLILATINRNVVLLAMAMPAAAFLVVAGLRFLYMRWFSVFPKNPLPKGLALFLMSTLVLFHLAYGVRYALVAWPNTPETKKAYVLK